MRTRLVLFAFATCALVACSSSSSSTSGSTGSTSGGGSSTGSATSGSSTTSGSSGSSGSTGGGIPGNTVEGDAGFVVQVAQELQYVTDGGGTVTFQDTAFLAANPRASVCGAQDLSGDSIQVEAISLGQPVAPGSYSPGSGTRFAAIYVQRVLADGGILGMSSGPDSPLTIDVTRADDGGFAGSYAGSIFPDGGPFAVSGSFDVAPCP